MNHSFARQTTLTCQHCGQTFTFDLWQIVVVDERPDLVEKILAGRLHDPICPNCKAAAVALDSPLLLYRPNEDYVYVFSPAEETVKAEQKNELYQLMDILEENMGAAWPKNWREKKVKAPVARFALPAFLKGGDGAMDLAYDQLIQYNDDTRKALSDAQGAYLNARTKREEKEALAAHFPLLTSFRAVGGINEIIYMRQSEPGKAKGLISKRDNLLHYREIGLEKAIKELEAQEGGDVPPELLAEWQRVTEESALFHKGNQAALDPLIASCQRILQHPAFPNVNLPFRLGVFYQCGMGFYSRYLANKQASDRDTGISFLRQVVELTPAGSPELVMLNTMLFHALMGRYGQGKDLADLEEGIQAVQQALALTPAGKAERKPLLEGLGEGLGERYKLNGNVADLDACIQAYREVVKLTPDGSAERVTHLTNLGERLRDRYKREGKQTDWAESNKIFQEVENLNQPGAQIRRSQSHLTNPDVGLKKPDARDGDLNSLKANRAAPTASHSPIEPASIRSNPENNVVKKSGGVVSRIWGWLKEPAGQAKSEAKAGPGIEKTAGQDKPAASVTAEKSPPAVQNVDPRLEEMVRFLRSTRPASGPDAEKTMYQFANKMLGNYEAAEENPAALKTILLVTDINGAEAEKYQVATGLVFDLRLQLAGFDGMRVLTAGESVTESSRAIDLGRQQNADGVVWGDYKVVNEKVQITLHVENLSNKQFSGLNADNALALQKEITNLASFSIRLECSSSMMRPLTAFISGMMLFQGGAFSQALECLNESISHPGWAVEPQSKSRILFYRGEVNLVEKHLDAATADYSQAVQLDPAFARIYTNRGCAYSLQGEREKAFADFSRAIEMNPQDDVAYFHRGVIYKEKGEIKKAIADFNQAVRIDPEDEKLYSNRGMTYGLIGDHNQAAADFSQVIRLNPQDDAAYSNRGFAYSQMGDYDRAIGDFTQALQFNPKDEDAYFKRGEAYQKKSEDDRAIADFTQAIQLEPTHADTYARRGSAFTRKMEFERGMADYNHAIQLDPRCASAYASRAILYNMKGENDKARADLNQAVALNPQFAGIYEDWEKMHAQIANPAAAAISRGEAYLNHQNYEKAIAEFSQAIQLKPDSAEVYEKRGIAYSEKGEYENAIKDFSRAMQIAPESGFAYFLRGKALGMLGNFDRAIADLSKAVQLGLKHKDVYFYRGLAYYNSGEYDQATTDFTQAIQLDRTYARAYTFRGLIYKAKNEYDEAIADFDQAMRFDPNNCKIYIRRAEVYSEMGLNDKAIADLKQAIHRNPKDAEAFAIRSLVYNRNNEYKKAQADLKQAVHLDPRYGDGSKSEVHPRGQDEKAVTANAGGGAAPDTENNSTAKAELTETLQPDPQDAAAYVKRGFIHFDKNDYESAIADCNQALVLDPQNEQAFYLRGTAYASKIRPDYPHAIEDLTRAIELNPEDGKAYRFRGLYYLNTGQKDKSIADLKQALQLEHDPKQQAAINGVLNTLLKKK